MKPNTKTQIELLQEGDRFYFSNDNKKIVHQVVKQLAKPRLIKYGSMSTVIFTFHPSDKNQVKSGREVVFLRNVMTQITAS